MCSIVFLIVLALVGTMLEMLQWIGIALVIFLVVAVVFNIVQSLRRGMVVQGSAKKTPDSPRSPAAEDLYRRRDQLESDIAKHERDVEFYRMALMDYPELDPEGRRIFTRDLAQAEVQLEQARREHDDVSVEIHAAEGNTDS